MHHDRTLSNLILEPAGHTPRRTALTFADGGSKGLVSKSGEAGLAAPLHAMHGTRDTLPLLARRKLPSRLANTTVWPPQERSLHER